MSDNDVELRHLRSFVKVAETLNFSRAAAGLHITQQSLSTQIQQLEKRLGVVVLHRTTRRVELTEAGEVLLGVAQTVLTDISTGLERVRQAADGLAGQLTLSLTPTIANDTLPALLKAVSEVAPDLTLQVSEMWQADSVEAVRTGRLDVGLARHPQLPPELDSVSIRQESLGAVVGSTHPASGRTTLTATDLNDSTMVLWPREFSPVFFDRVVSTYRTHGFDGPITEMHMLTRGSFLQDPVGRRMIQDGQAFSVAFRGEHDPLPEGFVWLPVDPGPVIAVHLFWRNPPAPRIDRLVQVARELSAQSHWT